MTEIEVAEINGCIIVRFRYPIANAIKKRDILRTEYNDIPKLNKGTFESFVKWISEEIDDTIGQALTSSTNIKNNDEPSTFEAW